MPEKSTTAIVVYQGVLVDEAEIFRFVLSRLPDFRTVTVGTNHGQVAGPGGVQTVEATLEEIGNPEIVVVPGGIGSHRRTEIASWLRSVSPRWILTSSTGSALLAAAGVLHDATATTHWLAGSLLERYGVHVSHAQVVIDGPIITCSGSSSAFRAALVVAEACGGPDLVAAIRADVAVDREKPGPPPRRGLWTRLRDAMRDEPVPPPPGPLDRALDRSTDDIQVVDLGMITPPRRDPPAE